MSGQYWRCPIVRGGGQRSPRWVSWLGLKTEKTAQTLDHVSWWLRDSRPHSLSITTMPIDLITSAFPPVDASRTRPTKLGVKAITGRSATAATHLPSDPCTFTAPQPPVRPINLGVSAAAAYEKGDDHDEGASLCRASGRRRRRHACRSDLPILGHHPSTSAPPAFRQPTPPMPTTTAPKEWRESDGRLVCHPLDFGGAVARTARR